MPEPAPGTHTEDNHMGSRALGGETRRALTPLLLRPFCLAASEETMVERKKRGGGGMLKEDMGGRAEGMCVCLAEWENAMC